MAAPIDPVAQILQAAAFTRQQVEALIKMGPAITLTAAQIIAALGYTPVPDSRTLTAGAGLVGGGDLTVDRSFAIDPAVLAAIGNALPLTLTPATVNAVSGAGHTHLVSGFLPLTGGTMTGPITQANGNTFLQSVAGSRIFTDGTGAAFGVRTGVVGAPVFAAQNSVGTNLFVVNDTTLDTPNKVVISNAAGISGGMLSMRVGANQVDVGVGYSSPTDNIAYFINRTSGANINYQTTGSGTHAFLGGPLWSAIGNVRSVGFSGAADSGVYYFGDVALDNYIYKQSGSNALIFRVGTVPFIATLNTGGQIITAEGGTMSAGLSFGSSVAASNTDVTRHIALFATTYGFGVTGNRLNYIIPAAASHRFVVGGVDIASIDNTNGLVVANVNIACIGGDMYSYRPGGASGVLFLNSAANRYLFNSGTAYEMPGQGLNVGGPIADPNGNVRTVPPTVQNAAYVLAASDFGRAVEKTAAGSIAYTLGAGGAAGDMITIVNSSTSGNVTITRSGSALYRNGVNADIVVGPGTAVTVWRSSVAGQWQA